MLRHRDRVYGFACQMLRDPDEAADVTQEVFIRLWNARESIDGKRIEAWLMYVTRNACIDVLRHRKTVRGVISHDLDAVDAAVAPDHQPDTVLEGEDFQRRLEQALNELSEPHRSIVVLRELHDMSYAEICAVLDLPMNTVKVYLHRARRSLRHRLAEAVDDVRTIQASVGG